MEESRWALPESSLRKTPGPKWSSLSLEACGFWKYGPHQRSFWFYDDSFSLVGAWFWFFTCAAALFFFAKLLPSALWMSACVSGQIDMNVMGHKRTGLLVWSLCFYIFQNSPQKGSVTRQPGRKHQLLLASFWFSLLWVKLQGTTTWGKQQISIKEKSYFSNWTLLFRAGSIIPVTGTKEESQNVFQDEILIFQERKMYFGAEQWECVGQSLSLSKAADRWNFRSQFFCCPGWLRCVWWKQNLATVKCLDGHFLKRGAPWCTSFRRCSTSIFKATSDVSSEILADEGKELQQFLHRDHGLESGRDEMYHKHFSSRRKLVWFILPR